MIANQNFSLESGEYRSVTVTVADVLVSSLSLATWVASLETIEVPAALPSITKTAAQITLAATSDGTGTVVSFTLIASDTLALSGTLAHELWLFDLLGNGVVVTRGVLTIIPALLVVT